MPALNKAQKDAREVKVREYLNKHHKGRTHTFQGDKETLAKMIKDLGFAKTADHFKVARAMDRRMGIFDTPKKAGSHRISSTNKASHRHRFSPGEILKQDNFYFRAKTVRRTMSTTQYVEFVSKYCEARATSVRERRFTPDKTLVDSFTLFQKGAIDMAGFMEKTGIKNKQKAYLKIGQVLTWFVNVAGEK